MKTKLFLALSCLLLLAVVGVAQPEDPLWFSRRVIERMQSPLIQQATKASIKSGMRSLWNGRGTNLLAFELLLDPESRTTLNVSDEQFQQVWKNFVKAIDTPEFREKGSIEQSLIGIDYPSEETMGKYWELSERLGALAASAICDAIDVTLTPEQKQKMQESQLAAMGEMSIISPNMFEILNLTDAQRQQMEEIKKELEPEFEKNLEMFADGRIMEMLKESAEFVKLGEFRDGEDIQIRTETVKKKLLEDAEYKKIHNEIHSNGKAFAMQFQIKMFDVLTDEQWDRLQRLIDNPPPYAKVLLKKMKEQKGESEKAGVWAPGPNSWQPGDPIPGGYREERNKRGNFPRPAEVKMSSP